MARCQYHFASQIAGRLAFGSQLSIDRESRDNLISRPCRRLGLNKWDDRPRPFCKLRFRTHLVAACTAWKHKAHEFVKDFDMNIEFLFPICQQYPHVFTGP